MTTRWTMVLGVTALVGCGTPVNNSGMSSDLDSGAATGGGGNACNEACAAQARANCSVFQMGNCVSGCQSGRAMFPQCASSVDALSRCIASATFTCSSSTNTPMTTGCRAETTAYVQCVAGDAGP